MQRFVRCRSKSESSSPNIEDIKKKGAVNGDLARHTGSEKMGAKCASKHENCLLLTKHFHFLAGRTTKDWKYIVRILGIEEHTIEMIEEDHPRSAYERAYQGYVAWQRAKPKEASFCVLFDTLELTRMDIKVAMEKEFDVEAKPVRRKPMYMVAVKYFVGRKEEIKRIRDFCKNQNQKRLLCIYGLPGSGKRELIMEALRDSDRSVDVQPKFMLEDKEKWTFKDILNCISKEMTKVVPHRTDRRGSLDVFDLLVNLDKPVLLILEIAHLNCSEVIFLRIWKFLYEVLRSKESQLKIIATSCKYPDVVRCEKVELDVINLTELDLKDSSKLLVHLNQNLSKTCVECIYKRLGGNPLLLSRVGAKIKNFGNCHEDLDKFITSLREINSLHSQLHRLLAKSKWWQDMECVFYMLDENEKEVLVKLSIFCGPIPKRSLEYIYKDGETMEDVEHLCNNHCILEKNINNTYYTISEVNRMFIMKYVESLEGHHSQRLKGIREESADRCMKYFLGLLQVLAKLFFSKSTKLIEENNDYTEMINDHKKSCGSKGNGWKSLCQCANFIVSKSIFAIHKEMILKSFRRAISHRCFEQLFDAPYELVQFLRYVLPYNELCELYLELWNAKNPIAKNQAVTLGCLVFIKVHKGSIDEQTYYLQMLDQCIFSLRANERLAKQYKEFLCACYMKKASIFMNTSKEVSSATMMLRKAEDITIRNDGLVKFFHDGVEADISYLGEDYENAKKLRETLSKRASRCFGTHPLSAKALYLLGKAHERIGCLPSAVSSYSKALKLYQQMDYFPLEFGKVTIALASLSRERNGLQYDMSMLQKGEQVVRVLCEKHQLDDSPFKMQSTRLLLSFLPFSTNNERDREILERRLIAILSQQKCVKKQNKYMISIKRRFPYHFMGFGSSFLLFLFLCFLIDPRTVLLSFVGYTVL